MRNENTRICLIIFVLLYVLTQWTAAFGAAPGFTAGSWLELSLPKLTYLTGETANASVIVNGIAATGTAGEVDLTAPVGATLTPSTLYMPSGGTGNFSITMPSIPGTYTFSASMSVYTTGVPNTCFSTDSVTVQVYSITPGDDTTHTINTISAHLGAQVVQQMYANMNPSNAPVIVMHGTGSLTLVGENYSSTV